MQGHALDDGVFIRSMATRGHLGGLALAAPEAIRVLAAAGIGLVLVETVGVGQVEVEIAGEADTTLVVVNPGWGDAVQASKAGLLEVADVFVVNKADRQGAAETSRDLENMLDINPSMGEWRPPVVLQRCLGEGVDRLGPRCGPTRIIYVQGRAGRPPRKRLMGEINRVRDLASNATWGMGGARFLEVAKDDLVARRVDPFRAERLVKERLARVTLLDPGSGPGHAAHLDRHARSRWAGTMRKV